MDLGLKGKSVLIFAASRGLGKASARQFAKEGARVLIASRDEDELKKTSKEIREESSNPDVAYAVCDITRAEEIKKTVEITASQHGTVDVLVNNAGGPPAGHFDDFDDETWQKAFELNLFSYIRTIREVLPYMREQGGGHIANIASSSIKQSLDNLTLSNTFRAGVLGLAKSLSQELAPDNILVNTIGPGKIATDRVTQLDEIKAKQQGRSGRQVRAESEQSIPIGRYGEPDEFANMVVYLCSGANTYVTGQAFIVDGGLVKAL